MNGLGKREVEESRKKYGTNEITALKKDTFFSLFIESLGDPIIKILLIALGIKTVFLFRDFDWYETIGIVIAILLASLISTISEYGSSKAFDRMMREASRIKCRVKREGKKKEIFASELVVGDLLYLEQGDKIGADGLIIKGEVELDESMISGEANSVVKKEKEIVYRGCTVYNGYAIARIDKVGNQTYYGRMVEELGSGSGTSPLKERLNTLAIQISRLGYIGAFLVSISYLFSKIVIANSFQLSKIFATLGNFPLMFAYLLHALTLSVTVIVVSVPEGLPLLVNLVLSSNMKRMLKSHVLVRKLVGIETAGSMNLLFTDKTGTITKGKLEVVEFMLGNGKKYIDVSSLSNRYQKIFKDSLVYNNESTYDADEHKIIGGNLTDQAILSYVRLKRRSSVSILKEVRFTSEKKYSYVDVIDDKKKYRYVKGAPEVLLKYTNRYLDEEGFKKLLFQQENILKKVNNLTEKGIRVLAVCYSENCSSTLSDLILVGFLLIKDDIREEAYEGVRLIQHAGVQAVMITGDNLGTASSIAREVGILDDEKVILSSNELSSLSDSEVEKILPKLAVLYRALPKDKSRLVNIAKGMNLVVGMTGDGVNDAIALKRADVGFAMGSGTEVAKEAADIVILDDNISSIASSILYGRTIFKSIRKFIIFQLTVNLCAVTISIVGPFIGIGAPVTVIQMLWINMVMDTLAGLAFSFEPPLKEYMEESPKKREEKIINRYMLNEILVTGIYSSILCLLFLKLPLISNCFRKSLDNRYLLTAFFGLFIFISIFNSFNARTVRLNILSNIFKNKMFIAVTLFIVIVQIVMIYYGGNLFRTSGLLPREFFIMLMISFSVIPIDFIRKMIYRKFNFKVEI